MKETTKRFIKFAKENGISVTITKGKRGRLIDIDADGVEHEIFVDHTGPHIEQETTECL